MRWLSILVLLLALAVCLEAGQRPRRGRYSRLGRKAHTVAGQMKRYQLKQRRRGETASNEVAAASRTGPRAKKGKPPKTNYRTKPKQLPKNVGRKNTLLKAARPARGKKQRKGAAKRRPVDPKDVCLFRALRRCGKRVIKKLSSSPDFAKRCRTKERFLDCMSLSQRRGCKTRKRRRRRGPSHRVIKQYRCRLQKLLEGARGCVIGVDLSAATPLTNR